MPPAIAPKNQQSGRPRCWYGKSSPMRERASSTTPLAPSPVASRHRMSCFSVCAVAVSAVRIIKLSLQGAITLLTRWFVVPALLNRHGHGVTRERTGPRIARNELHRPVGPADRGLGNCGTDEYAAIGSHPCARSIRREGNRVQIGVQRLAVQTNVDIAPRAASIQRSQKKQSARQQ